MRIAHLTTADISLALLLSTELSERVDEGHTVFGVSAPGRYVERIEALGVTHVPVMALSRSWGLAQDVRAFIELSRTIRSLDLDVLHTHNPKTGVMGRIAGRLAGVPVVVNTCHGLWATPEDSLAKRAFVYGLEGLAARFSDFELFQNAQDEHTLRRFLKPGRHRVVGNGIDLERFRFDPAGRARLRAEWGIGDDEILVGTVGRRVREKGLAEYAAVARALTGRARFVWVGPEDATDSDASSAIDTSGITFISEQTDMPAVYSAFDLFVLASHREGFSRASMEAAACGRPMVLTDIRGCREIGDDGVHVLLVPPRNSALLTTTVADLVDDKTQRSRLALAARERALTAFDQRQVAQMSFRTYDDVARGRGLTSLRRDRRPLVWHLLPHDRRRGAQAYAGHIRDALATSGEQRHEAVTLFDGPPGALRPDIALRIPASRLPGRSRVRAIWSLRRLVRNLRPDIVVAYGGEPLQYSFLAAGPSRTVYRKIGLSEKEVSRTSRTVLYGHLARGVRSVVAVSTTISEQVRSRFGVAPERIAVIPNGRDPQIFFPRGKEEYAALPPLVLFVGHLEAGKRPFLFLDVVQELRDAGVEFSAAVAGDGPLMDSLTSRAENLQVELLGSRSDVPDLLRAAAVVVMTSAEDTEGMPGVLVEAGLSGVPVVSTRAAGVTDVVVDGVTGFVSDSDAAASLASDVNRLLVSPALRSQLGEAAVRHCRRLFSIEAAAGQWEAHLGQLVTSRGMSSA